MRPPTFKASPKSLSLCIKMNRPIFKAHSAIAKRQNDVVATVSTLRMPRGPVAIVWGIALLVVPAFDGMELARTQPHVSDEVLEVQPALAHSDSAPTVVCIRGCFRIEAAIFHRVPNAVLRGMNESMIAGFEDAAATPDISSLDVICSANKFIAAMATEHIVPSRLRVLMRLSQDTAAVKYLSS